MRTVLTVEQFYTKMKRETEAGPEVTVEGQTFKRGVPHVITGVEIEELDGVPCLILNHRTEEGEEFGVILNRQYATELLEQLGPHPIVEEFFRLH